MKRVAVLAILMGFGCLPLIVSGFQAPSAKALAATKIEKLKDNLYVITGSGVDPLDAFSGGNTAVFITESGVVVVDTKLPGWGPTILDRIKSVTNKPVTTIINTHTHNDHTGSNEFFGATVDSVVHENTKANMAKMDEFKGAQAKFLPKRTYKDKLTIGKGKDEIDLYYFGAGHTNGDSFVVFPAIRTMHVGDMFAWKALPYIDTGNGGSAIDYPKTVAAAGAKIKGVETVIPGHSAVTDWTAFQEYGRFMQAFHDAVAAGIKQGKTADEITAALKLPDQFKDYAMQRAKDDVAKFYADLKK